MEISNSRGWFQNEPLPLNPGLVAIIGQKGSGKSALAELVALACGSWYADEGASFISRAGKHIEGTRIRVKWGDQSTTEKDLIGAFTGSTSDVRYLSQRFVERLCSEDYAGAELVKEIEGVIFAHLDPTETLNASSFSDLRQIRTSETRTERADIRKQISRMIEEWTELSVSQLSLTEKEERLAALVNEKSKLESQLPKEGEGDTRALADKIAKVRDALAAVQAESAKDKQLLTKIATARTTIALFADESGRFFQSLSATLREVGVSENEIANFEPIFRGDVSEPLNKSETRIQGNIASREGVDPSPAEGTIKAFVSELNLLEGQLKLDAANKEKLRQMQERIASINAEMKRIETEIARIKGPERERLHVVARERFQAYLRYIANLKKEQEILERLYAPIQARLSSGLEQERRLEFFIRWNVEEKGWFEKGLSLFDQRKTQPFGSTDAMASYVEAELLPAWRDGNRDALDTAINAFHDRLLTGNPRPDHYLKAGVQVGELLNWIFDIEHVRLSYGLRYDGTELEKLSPGTKGVVLLILYLGMDDKDNRPLIVDQPEENLDSESIFALLASYFRQAKRRRQIILITHNPNLVVNTDAEQVIVATASRREEGLPAIRYHAGSLENTAPSGGIRSDVCRILEGGAAAFQKREERYAFKRG